MTTTPDTITTDQISALRNEAAEAGDQEMYDICGLALDGDTGSVAECARVIAESEKMAADRPPHPDDARQALRDLAQRRSQINHLEAEVQRDLAPAIEQALEAGLSKTEIAELSGMSRSRLYQRLA
ncbi:MAG: hypothetical protein ACOCT8_03145 [Actinomycetota bacterium]